MLLPELNELERLLETQVPQDDPQARTRLLARVPCGTRSLPIWALSLGTSDPSAPSLAYVGGVHGLERIGTQVVLAYLRTLLVRFA